MLSELLDDGLTLRERADLRAHLRSCEQCRASFESLSATVDALHALRTEPPPTVTESALAVARVPIDERGSRRPGSPSLRVLRGGSRSARARGAYRTWRSRLRVVIAITVAIGVPITAINPGGMIASGRIDVLGVCECALNFLVPFLALSVAAAMTVRGPWQRRF
jgi:hypothetical protein